VCPTIGGIVQINLLALPRHAKATDLAAELSVLSSVDQAAPTALLDVLFQLLFPQEA
jgi:hypothetical protein